MAERKIKDFIAYILFIKNYHYYKKFMGLTTQLETYGTNFSSISSFQHSFSYHFKDDEVDNMDYDDEEKGPALEIYGTDLTLLARQGQLEECFGREK